MKHFNPHQASSLNKCRDNAIIPLSPIDMTRLELIAREEKKSMEKLLREAVGDLIQKHRDKMAAVMKF